MPIIPLGSLERSMLKGVIACGTPGMASILREMAAGLDITIQQVVDTTDLVEAVNQAIYRHKPDILLLELDLKYALTLANSLQSHTSRLKIVGISTDISIGRAARDAGVDQVLIAPFGEQDFFQTVRLALNQQRADSAVFAFLPAKG